MFFSAGQLDKLSELCLDIAKALFIAAFATPAIVREATIVTSLQSMINAVLFTYLSLFFIKRKETI